MFAQLVAERASTLRELVQDVLPAEPTPGAVLDPVGATDYLQNVQERLVSRAQALVEDRSPAAWLWYTRRTSRAVFRGRLKTTETSDHALLEQLTALSNSRDDDGFLANTPRLLLPITADALEPLAELALVTIALSQVHAWLRRAGKGTRFTVLADDLPEPVEDEDLEEAISEFDQRVDDDSQAWHSTLVDIGETGVEGGWPLLTVSTLVADWPEVPTWSGPMKHRKFTTVLGHYVPHVLTMQGLREVVAVSATSGDVWWAPELPALVVLLQALYLDGYDHSKHLGENIASVGYTLRGRTYTVEMLDTYLPHLRDDLEELFPGHVPTSGEAALRLVEAIQPTIWPLRRGPVIRPLGDDTFVIDVFAATHVLRQQIAIPGQVGGQLVNAVADRLEDAAQNLIDESPWRPMDALRALRRRRLRINGQDLTDFDAVGALDGTLLFVSAKHLNYTADYDAGIYATVRNARTTVEDAVDFWDNVSARLRSDPVGDNFDLSSFSALVGVVVTPHVMFVQSGSSRRVVATSNAGTQLRAYSSLGELRRFLNA